MSTTDPRRPYPDTTPLARALNVVGGKWELLIVHELRDGPVRFVELQRTGAAAGISTESLRVCLNRLCDQGVVSRRRYRETPPRVDYSLTHRGEALGDAIDSLACWAVAYTETPAEAVAA